ncbi:peroxiredoxin family protein [Altibacter sp. HG106]|uniref:peroxiredoxin family protein n=1 Tax=Altibacter sp. HG106 TaxID=3023937 RepID=UPI0023509668|nr:TlpA disulfide reductase family protein [Altibacter sp. HG106]MDC7993878.1 TlpA disulfide reductase family protein [Altibacter sp. HG106]
MLNFNRSFTPFLGALIVSIFLLSCASESKRPKPGDWRLTFQLTPEKTLPVTMHWSEANVVTITNASEVIEWTDIAFDGDSVVMSHPVFEGVFKGVFSEAKITGKYIKPSLDRVVPFEMEYENAARFQGVAPAQANVSGTWETVFSPESESDRYIAKGIFEQMGDRVTGTFRTLTGDYRFLEGIVEGDSLRLSTFDGAHVFLFEAKVSDSTMNGTFYSGNHWVEPFVAKRNDEYELQAADSLTFLKPGYETLAFEFPNTEGELVSLEDPKFQDKVVIVQIMGTWCPNCLDETEYYVEYLKENDDPDLEFVSLAFEYAPTQEKAMEAISRLKERKEVPYPILLAQYGSSDKQKANDKLPMLNHVLSYPTTIFLDKQGKVRKIHTGFNGKATGEVYTEFTQEFERFVASLLQE